MIRPSVLLAPLVFLAACGPADVAPPRREATAVRAAAAADWLWSQQAADGGWHSDTYGLMRSGQSLTPFVLDALVAVPARTRPPAPEAVNRAAEFIARHVDSKGALGRAEAGLEDYPTYATSLAVTSLVRSRRGDDLRPRLVAWLRGQQFSETLGWRPGDAPFGAWGMGGEPHRPPSPGHVDLSMTRHAIEALAASGAAPDDPALNAARVFLALAANDDGGFRFSPVVLAANKAGEIAPGKFRSYGTATADGVLALLALGTPLSDARVVAARDWLVEHHRIDRVPGIEPREGHDWGAAMVLYYRAVSARAFRALGVKEAPAGCDWRADLAAALAREQRTDGSFATKDFLMKEDDPLIATTLAVIAWNALSE